MLKIVKRQDYYQVLLGNIKLGLLDNVLKTEWKYYPENSAALDTESLIFIQAELNELNKVPKKYNIRLSKYTREDGTINIKAKSEKEAKELAMFAVEEDSNDITWDYAECTSVATEVV